MSEEDAGMHLIILDKFVFGAGGRKKKRVVENANVVYFVTT